MQVGLAGFKLLRQPRLFGRFGVAGAGETISTPVASVAAARGARFKGSRARAERATELVWNAMEVARGYENPWEELPFLGCWLYDNGANSGSEADYYCERYLEGPRDQKKWTQDRVAWWLSLTGDWHDYFNAVPEYALAEAVALAWRTLEEQAEGLRPYYPEPMARELTADLLDLGVTRGGVRLVNLDRDDACRFIEQHHSALPYCNKRGLMYALGAVVEDQQGPVLVAVATAGTPTGAWDSRGCSQHGTLELTRVASIAGVKTRDRHGRIRPLNASSKLTSRIMDLLPSSGREGEKGCRFVTYSLDREQGTTYLALASKGLRPVRFAKGKTPTGARRKAGARNLGHVDKIVWEAGPAARPPKWELVPRAQRAGAERAFAQYLEQQRRRA